MFPFAGPKSLWPADDYLKTARALEKKHGAKLTITEDPQLAVEGADFIHTDVWVSMGEPRMCSVRAYLARFRSRARSSRYLNSRRV